MNGYDALNVNVLNVAKDEYTKQLNSILAPLIMEGIDSIYKDAKKVENENDIIHNFQLLLKEVPHWNTHIISTECERINKVCDWLHDLVTAVFVTNVKILTSVKIVNKSKQFKLKMPNFDTFIHAVYIEVARFFFHNPFLLYEYDRITKRNKNKKESLRNVQHCVEETIRVLLPVQHILKEYMQDNGDEEDEDYQMLDKDSIKSASEIVNPNITQHSNADNSKLKNMVQRELDNNKNMYEMQPKKQTNDWGDNVSEDQSKDCKSQHNDLESVYEDDEDENEVEENDEKPVPLNTISQPKSVTLNGNDNKSRRFIEQEMLNKERHQEEKLSKEDEYEDDDELSDISNE